MKKITTIIMLAFCTLVSGCFEPKAVETKTEDAHALVNKLTFAKNAKTGLCFGVATTERVNTAGNYSMSVMMVPVDCEKVNL